MKLLPSPIVACTLLTAALTPAFAGTLGTFTSDATGFDTHTYYYDDGEEVTVIDTQFMPQLTQGMVEQIRKQTQSPITRVIVTHPNPDKFNGLPLLHAMGVESIASEATADAMPGVHAYKKHFWTHVAKAFTEQSYPKFEMVKKTFKRGSTITLKSGETISLFELKHSGVSGNQTVVRIDSTGDLIVGDLVHYKAHAWLEGGIVNGQARPDLAAWREALSELPALAAGKAGARVFGGRGEPALVGEAAAYQKAYLAKADDIVSRYIAVVPARELKDPAKAQAHYQVLQKQFEQAFPQARLPYLVGHGVYGLVASKLR